MKVFVTGSSGFIGKHLVPALLEAGHNVTINIHKDKSSFFSESISTYSINESKPEDLISHFQENEYDGIIHLASLYIVNHHSNDIPNLINSNIRFGSIVLDCAAKAKVKWFLNTGTFWQHFQNKMYSPVNLYAATKQAFQDIAKFYQETNQIQFCTLKLSDTFGPNDIRPKIFNLWDKISDSEEMLDMSLGEQEINISYIDNVIDAFLLLIVGLDSNSNKIENGDEFAVNAEEVYSLKELSEIYQDETNKKLNINWGGRPYREREVMKTWNSGKLVPGWKPKVSIREGIKKMMQ